MRDESPCKSCSNKSTWWKVRLPGSDRIVTVRDRPRSDDGGSLVGQVTVGTDGLCYDCRQAKRKRAKKPAKPEQKGLFDKFMI